MIKCDVFFNQMQLKYSKNFSQVKNNRTYGLNHSKFHQLDAIW